MYNVIDLFCGIGGFSKGFEKAGFNILSGIDIWPTALETFSKNHKNASTLLADIRNLDNNFFLEYREKIDVLIAGPPCQGFSMSGKRDPKDKRNTLSEEIVRIVSLIKPNVIVMENVVGLLSMKTPDGIYVKDIITKKFNEINYKIKYKVLNAADYGVPQIRKRVIFIASNKIEPVFPGPIHAENITNSLFEVKINKWVTTKEALSNIPDIGNPEYTNPKNEFQKMMSNSTKKIYNHEGTNHNKEVLKRMSLVPSGGNWKDIPKEFYNVGGIHSNNYRRLDPDKPSITLKHASKSMIIHYKYDRGLSVREVARLQSFYDNFILCGTKAQQHQQLANAVPPSLGYSIAKKIKIQLSD